MTRSRHIHARRHRWTRSEIVILRREYPDQTAARVASLLKVTIAVVYRKAHDLGIRKSAEFLASERSGQIRRAGQTPEMVAARFPKGHVPANKGLRRPGWAPGRMAETQFRKGNRPHTWKPVGSHRINADGYLDRKVTDTGYPPRDWIGVHRLVWIRHRGKIPRGHVVAFKSGRRTAVLKEITVGRIECISRKELAHRNRMWNIYPKPLAMLIQLRGQLKRKIREKESRAQDHQ